MSLSGHRVLSAAWTAPQSQEGVVLMVVLMTEMAMRRVIVMMVVIK